MNINSLLLKVNQVLEGIALIDYKVTSLFNIYQVFYISTDERTVKEFYIDGSQFELILEAMSHGIPEFITKNEFDSVYNLYFLTSCITEEDYNLKLQDLQLQDVLK